MLKSNVSQAEFETLWKAGIARRKS
jgi:hypothetical protein